MPVSGCIPGSDNGREVTYNEQTTETRSRRVDERWDQGWVPSTRRRPGKTVTNGTSHTNEVSFSTTDGTTFGWSHSRPAARHDRQRQLQRRRSVSRASPRSGASGALARVLVVVHERDQRIAEPSRRREVDVRHDRAQRSDDRHDERLRVEIALQSTAQSNGDRDSDLPAARLQRDNRRRPIRRLYRQETQRLIRQASVIVYNKCGMSKKVADLDITDWAWSPTSPRDRLHASTRDGPAARAMHRGAVRGGRTAVAARPVAIAVFAGARSVLGSPAAARRRSTSPETPGPDAGGRRLDLPCDATPVVSTDPATSSPYTTSRARPRGERNAHYMSGGANPIATDIAPEGTFWRQRADRRAFEERR